MPSTKTLLGAAAFCAALAGGGVAGALIGAPAISGAQEEPTTTTTVAPDGTKAPPDATGGDDRPDGKPGCHGELHGAKLEVAAKAIGISVDDLRTALDSGKTIADVANDNKVDPQTVIDALVADASARIDQAVKDGKLDQARADEEKAELPARVKDFVNGVRPERGFGGPGGHHHGPRPANAPAGDTGSS
jgi:hypothetical protein